MGDLPATTLPEGSIIGERYRVLGHLGTGGMGAVYRVEHTMMSKQLALKLLRPELSTQPSVIERFEREARSAARLDHAHIVRITDFGKTSDGALFMVMELVEGLSLSEHLVRRGPLPIDRALTLLDQILDALAHAHANAVIHRDVKPANIMLTEAAPGATGPTRAKLVDFGIAKITAREADDTGLTQVGAVIGTPRYMSPEQAAGEAIDLRTDLYAVGVLAFELLTGRAPFEGTSSVEVLSKHLTAAVPPMLMQGVDPARKAALEAVVRKALAKRREERFATAEALREALREASESGGPAGTRSDRPRAELARGERTHALREMAGSALAAARRLPRRIQLGAAAALAVLLIGAAMLTTSPTRPARTLVENGEAAVGRGDLPAARAIAMQALAKDPDDGRAHLLQATIAMAEDHPEVALTSFRQAIALDRKLAADPLVENAVRTQVARDGKAATGLLTLVASEGTAASAPLLVELAKTAPKPGLRKEAYVGLERLEETARLDVLAWLTEELRTTKQGCEGRKWYVDRLIALDDPRTLPTLKKELGRRGGFLNLSSESECMAAELKAQIKALEPPKEPKE